MVLQDNKLYTFSKEKQYDKPTEDIDLSNHTDCIVSSKGNENGFRLIGKTKQYPDFYFTSSNKQAWLSFLCGIPLYAEFFFPCGFC